MKWFSENEFKCKCCGELPEDVAGNVRALVKEVLDPLREKYGKAIRVNSGYRCKHHNLEVGGAVGVNGSLKCSDFGNFKCSVFGNNTTVDSATMVQ